MPEPATEGRLRRRVPPLLLKLLLPALLLTIASGLPSAPRRLESTNHPPRPMTRLKTDLEHELEEVIDRAYREYFRVYRVAGNPLILRIPFAQHRERRGGDGFEHPIVFGGKGEPRELWPRILTLLESSEFAAYTRGLLEAGPKAIAFDLQHRSFRISWDRDLVEQLRHGPYPGTPTLVFVLKEDREVSSVDVYNYLYCVGSVGVDCSGFVYHLQKAVARALGADLDAELGSSLQVPPQSVPQLAGLWLFDPDSGHAEGGSSAIEDLRPGDVFLFRGWVRQRGLYFRHSAVIQSIDLRRGLIRYLQCTDWAPPGQRGVHESWIRFDPGYPARELGHPSVQWSQQVQPAFAGESSVPYWRNDGERYRAFPEAGGTLIVRLRLVKELVKHLDPGYYRNHYAHQ